MNWSLIILGIVALSSVTFAKNSYLVILPKLLKVGYDNQISVFIATGEKPVEVKFDLMIGQKHIEGKTMCKPGETQNATITLPKEFPVGVGQLTIKGTGGVNFEEKRDIIIYDNRHVILVQTASSAYRPSDTMEIRVIATDENLIPIENGELTLEIYDPALKLVGEFQRVPIRSGLTETLKYPLAEHVNVGTWLVTAIIGNTTSSVEVLVSRPVTPSFDLKAIFQRFILRTDKMLRGFIEISDDKNRPIFGRGKISIGQITEENFQSNDDQWRQWKSQQIEISGRMEVNYDLLSLFNVDVSKALAVQIYIQVTDLMSGKERVVRHIIPVFTRDVVYDIRPLEFEPGMKNEFEIIAKRPDGKPTKMEDMIVTAKMFMGNEQGKQQGEKSIEIKDFYTRGRNDVGLFNFEIPENCIGLLMTITPLGDDGKVRGYRTHAIPLMPTPRRRDAKLSIELLPSTSAPVHTNVNVPVISSQISTVGRTSEFYIQLIPSKPVEKFEKLPMSYVLMTNGRLVRNGQFYIEPSRECQSKSVRSIQPEVQTPPSCVFNGTLPIEMTRDMVPYSTLLVYTFQPSFGFNVAESYRFSVAGLFQSSLTLNATIVPHTSTETVVENFHHWNEINSKPIKISDKVQDKTRIQLSYTTSPESIVGLNVFEYDGVLNGLSDDITKERLLKYLTKYEQIPIFGMSSSSDMKQTDNEMVKRTMSEKEEEEWINRERMGSKVRYPIEKLIFGLSSHQPLPPLEGDDIYTASNMERLYGDVKSQQSSTHYRRKFEKSINQYDITVGDNDYDVATSFPIDKTSKKSQEQMTDESEENEMDQMDGLMYERPRYGSPLWYERMNSKLKSVSQEAFIFVQSGLNFVSDFDSLRLPMEMKYENLTKLFMKFREQRKTLKDQSSFSIRDEARQLLEEYMMESDSSMVPPEIMLEERSRTGYYRSIFFNTSSSQSQSSGKIILPRTKPYSTWLATGFSLNGKTGLSIAQPIRLPTNQGLYILGECPQQVQTNERVRLTYGVNNYLGKDVNNVIVRIRSSPDFDLIDQTKSEQIISIKDKDYSYTIPSLKSFASETRQLIFVPKRSGLIEIVMEVESEFGGDYEIMNIYVRDSGIERKQVTPRLYDLTTDKKSYGPIVEKIQQSPELRKVMISVSGTGLDRFVEKYSIETNSLIGIDRALVRLYRSLSLRHYLNTTSQRSSPLFNMTFDNITTAYQQLQLYNDYDGSYSFVSDEGTKYSSLYLTSLAFGAMISPMMTFRDNVSLNRTLNWILSHQNEDGSFDDKGPCYHYRFCSGQYRRESLTAIVLYSLTRDNSSDFMPEFIRSRLFNGENSSMKRAEKYLISRVPQLKSDPLTLSLFELAMIQNRNLSAELREKIHNALLERKLTSIENENSKYFQFNNEKTTYDDQLLMNAMTASLYTYFGDYKTSLEIIRWMIKQLETHPHYDSILDAVFRTDFWNLHASRFRQTFGTDKFDVTVDVQADNGEKHIFKLNSTNMDLTEKFYFTLPMNEITYSVNGFGFVGVRLIKYFSEEKQQKSIEPMPFKLTQEWKSMSSASEIAAKTCVNYSPNSKEISNRTVVVEIEIPTGMRINMRKLGFDLNRIEQIIYFSYEPCGNKLLFFMNVPSNSFGQSICFDWCLERLSTVVSLKPTTIRVYDYLQPETQLIQLTPIEI